MAELQFIRADDITGVSADVDQGWARIHFLQNSIEAALQIDVSDVERLIKGLAGLITDMAEKKGVSYAQRASKLITSPNLDGVTLTFQVDDLGAQSIHLSQDQASSLRDILNTMFEAQGRMRTQ